MKKISITKVKRGKQILLLANDLFAMLGRRDDFREWLANRIDAWQMESSVDFFIFLSEEAVEEVLKHESIKEKDVLALKSSYREMCKRQMA